MKKFKRLFIDNISSDFNINEDITLGPWCLLNQFDLNKIKKLQKRKIFIIDDKTDQIDAFKTCELQHSRILEEFAIYIKSINLDKHSLEFYKNYTSNWLSSFIHIIHYSERLINIYIEKYKKENINIILFYKPKKIIFKNSSDFINKCIIDYNFFSNFVLFLLLKKKPESWKITYCNNDEKKNNNRISKFNFNLFTDRLKGKIFKILSPRVNEVYGLNIFERVLLSLILLLKKPIKKNMEIQNYYSKINANIIESPLDDNRLISLAKELIPISFKEIHKKNEKYFNCRGKIMLCSASSILVDDDKRLSSMLFKENGGKIVSIQHGGHYGELYVIRGSMEFGFDKFISWGQKRHPSYELDFKPLPSPQLKLNYKKNKSDKILFASTVNFFHYPRYIACQSFGDTVNRIDDTTTFLSELSPQLIKKINYNLHLGQFTEEKILKKKFSDLKFINSSLEKNLNKSQLVIQNHYSTFFLKCLAANAPTICFFKRNNWKLNDRALKFYDNLHKAEILFYDPKKAAEKVSNNWDDLDGWWNQKSIQSARIDFCNEFALKDNKWLKKWINYFFNEF